MVRDERKFLPLGKIMTEIQAKFYNNTKIKNNSNLFIIANISDTKTYSFHSKNTTLIRKIYTFLFPRTAR